MSVTIRHSHGVTERHDTLNAALDAIATVYGADYAIEGVEYLEEPAQLGHGRALVWASEQDAHNDDGTHAVAVLTASVPDSG
jgi:hypothetical protein